MRRYFRHITPKEFKEIIQMLVSEIPPTNTIINEFSTLYTWGNSLTIEINDAITDNFRLDDVSCNIRDLHYLFNTKKLPLFLKLQIDALLPKILNKYAFAGNSVEPLKATDPIFYTGNEYELYLMNKRNYYRGAGCRCDKENCTCEGIASYPSFEDWENYSRSTR